MQLKKLRSKLGEGLGLLKNLRPKMSHDQILQVSILSIILLIAFSVRLLPMRWGFHLSEFDPYSYYRSAEYIVKNGFGAWFGWTDYQRWYPHGVQVSKVYFPGVPFTAVFFYKIIQILALPISLYELTVIFPLIMATLTCLLMYFWGRDTWGKTVGLFSALFLALNGSYIGRTSLGWFDTETAGIFGIVLFAFLFLRSLDDQRSWNSTVIYAVASGLSLGYIFASWGAAYYLLGLTSLFMLLLLLLGKYSRRLLLSYSITLGLGLFIAVNVPKLSTRFLLTSPVLGALFVFSLLCLWEILRNTKTNRWKLIYTLVFFALVGVAFLVVAGRGTTPIAGKFFTVMNPFARLFNPIVESVQEHRPPAWGSFYYDYGFGVFFVVVGMYFAARNPTKRNLFLVLYALTSIYFASSMVRLLVILAPSFSMLWAIGLVGVLKPFILVMREVPRIPFRKKYVLGHVGKEYSGVAIILVFVLLSFSFILPTGSMRDKPRVFEQAYSPVTLMASGIPLRPEEPILEWYDILMWMKHELPADAIVVSWWDYGYWISIIANKTTLADNGTINTTQIGLIGRIFLSNETQAIKILKEQFTTPEHPKPPTHILVFTTFYTDGVDRGFGDEGKWMWMAKIANSSDRVRAVHPEFKWAYHEWNNGRNNTFGYGTQTNERSPRSYFKWNELGQQTLIYKMIAAAKNYKQASGQWWSPPADAHKFRYFKNPKFSEGADLGGIYAVVVIYEIDYEQYELDHSDS